VTDEESIHKNEETDKLEGKMFRLKREAIREFDILKAEQGPRSGPPEAEQHETKPARQTTAGAHGLVRGAMARSEQKTKTK
jgi:hypothetical protein